MANAIQTVLELPERPMPGEDIEAEALAALAALQTIYEHGQPPLVLEPMPGRSFETTNQRCRYKLPLPYERNDEAFSVEVWVYCATGAGAQQWDINGSKDDVDLVGWNGPFTRDLVDADDLADFYLGPNANYIGDPIFVGCVAIFAARARTELPEADFDNGATPIDTAQIAADKPVSVHRLDDGRKMALECYRRQYRSALQVSNMTDQQRHVAEIEIPDTSAPTVTLLCNVYGVEGDELHIDVEGQTLDLDVNEDAWEAGTITIAAARDGQIRPYRARVKLELDVDSTIQGLSLVWQWVDP